MQITTVTTTTTIHVDDDPVAFAAQLERETGYSVDGNVLDEDHTCNACGDPLEADRISGHRGMSEQLCRDCELEHENPVAWYRIHPESPRYEAVRAAEGRGVWNVLDHANSRLVPAKGSKGARAARMPEDVAKSQAQRLCAESQPKGN